MFGKPKIRVDVINPTGLKKKKYPLEDNHVVIRKAKRGPGGTPYTAKFDRHCLIPYWVGYWPFKRLKQKLMLIEGADECVSFDFHDGEAGIDMPIWSRESETDLFKASVIKAAGATVQKIQVPALLYFMVGMVLFLQFVSFLVATGKVRFV